ncbi:MAG TPA: hypothetical protein PLT77_03165, partial [Burkholderiaceae bacterium]|nr:hypothetical protein [Burkholderiaceae bacterium]
LFLTKSGESYSQSDKDFLLSLLRKGTVKQLIVVVTQIDVTYQQHLDNAEANDEDPEPLALRIERERRRLAKELVATLAELSEDALVQILLEPKNALVKQYAKLFSMEGVDLEIRPTALKAIARKALARKTGARGLRSILEQSLIDTMFDLPTTANVEKVVVDESTIEENKPPLLVYRELAKKA